MIGATLSLPNFTTPLEAALSYAQRDWPVLPLHTIDNNGQCTCHRLDCPHPGKHPFGTLAPNGKDNASTDPAVIRDWWKRRPDANVGVLTGSQSGLAVIDVDPRKGGDDTLRDLEDQYGKLPDTIEAITGGGGRHILFAHPGGYIKGGSDRLGSGLDVKADGGYIVGAPSLHLLGCYQWDCTFHPDDTPLAPLPDWLLSLLSTPEARTSTNGHTAQSALERIPEGRRNSTLTSYAGSMRRRGLGERAMEAALLVENSERCDPPLEDDEVRAIARSVARYEPEPDLSLTLTSHNGHSASFSTKSANGNGNGIIGTVTVTVPPVYFHSLAAPPPRVWIVPDFLPEGVPISYYGDGGSTKSFFALYTGLCVASGSPMLGRSVQERPVGYVDFELDQHEQHRRALAVAKGLGLDDVPTTFAYFPCIGYTFLQVVSSLQYWLWNNQGGVIIIDSFGVASTGDTKDEAPVIAFMRDIRALGAGGTIIVDHQGKLAPGEDYARKTQYGNVYKQNLSRLVWQFELVESAPGLAIVMLRCKKTNLSYKADDLGVEVLFDDVGGTVRFREADMTNPVLADKAKLELRILAALQRMGQATIEALSQELGESYGSVKAKVAILKGRGKVVPLGKDGRKNIYAIASPAQGDTVSKRP